MYIYYTHIYACVRAGIHGSIGIAASRCTEHSRQGQKCHMNVYTYMYMYTYVYL